MGRPFHVSFSLVPSHIPFTEGVQGIPGQACPAEGRVDMALLWERLPKHPAV